MAKKNLPNGFNNEIDEPLNNLSAFNPLQLAINSLCEHYTPVSTVEECNGLLLTTMDFFRQLQLHYPSDSYDAGTVTELLNVEGWETFYHPSLGSYYWKVKKNHK